MSFSKETITLTVYEEKKNKRTLLKYTKSIYKYIYIFAVINIIHNFYKLKKEKKKNTLRNIQKYLSYEYLYPMLFTSVSSQNYFLPKRKKNNSEYYPQYSYLMLFTTRKLLSSKRKRSNNEYYPQIEEEECSYIHEYLYPMLFTSRKQVSSKRKKYYPQLNYNTRLSSKNTLSTNTYVQCISQASLHKTTFFQKEKGANTILPSKKNKKKKYT